ncbi:MAG: hypothetical protein ACJ8HJ_17150 [Massilia sp.]
MGPLRLASYRAASTRATRSSGSSSSPGAVPATPGDIVTKPPIAPGCGSAGCSRPARRASPTRSAPAQLLVDAHRQFQLVGQLGEVVLPK